MNNKDEECQKSIGRTLSNSSTSSNQARKVVGNGMEQQMKVNPRIGSQPSTNELRKPSCREPSDTRRIDSEQSMGSIGIGITTSKVRQNTETPPRLYPDGNCPPGQSIYDCIVYLFYCCKHDRLAVTNIERNRVVWFPFVPLESGVTYMKAARNMIGVFLGRRDQTVNGTLTPNSTEPDNDHIGRLPRFTSQHIHELRCQLPSGRSFTRISHFVQIDSDDEYPCCQTTIRLTWILINDILQDQIECLWGPEVKLLVLLLIKPEPIFCEDFTREQACWLLNNPAKNSMYQSRLLQLCKINQDIILNIFEDYIEHCFPAIYMSFESLKSYLVKYGWPNNDPRFMWIFQAFGYNRKGYLDFNEFLVGLLTLEPTTEHGEARFRLLFRYYDVDKDDSLSIEELLSLLTDLNPKANNDQLREMVQQANKYGMVDNRLSFESFQRAISTNKLKGTSTLCRSPKVIIPKIVAESKRRITENSLSDKGGPKSDRANNKLQKRADRICSGCRIKHVEWCMHTLRIDASGMCQKPERIIELNFSPNDPMVSPIRYSGELVFSGESMFGWFTEKIREYYYLNDQSAGFMASPEEANNFASGVQSMCAHVSEVLESEDRLIRTNAPVIIIGELDGRLDLLLNMERNLWPSIPVMQSSLIFLGNYIGNSRYNVELLCYLLAFKMMAPNRVHLLRGTTESRQENKNVLLTECRQKYGNDFGDFIWEQLNLSMDRLSIAALMMRLYFAFIRESPLAHQIIHNIPTEYDSSLSGKKVRMEVSSNVGSRQCSSIPNQTEFNLADFNNFMTNNRLSYVIRSNDPLRCGYRLLFGGRCLTIASVNESIVAFVDGSNATIRLIRVTNHPIKTEQEQNEIQRVVPSTHN
ncbi:hypothetical protein RDWZM_009438 [Blomia tropicalis]|uniref:EF-hand domain-containing protein n=1 Tax=Blomia tropicalis TaxID=40697 RepID=A0A9Q0M2Y7_BLOTA|nr:hypothetical protein RDWZM_009438 [Blomia tropicalis]